MKNFNEILKTCNRVNKLSAAVIDKKLIYFAAENDKLADVFYKKVAKYKHVASELEKSSIHMFASQYIAYEIFKDGGLIKKYLNHSRLPSFSQEELEYMKWHFEKPWRFSYSVILDKPENDFYEMLDVFTNERYLLYSKGVGIYLSETNVNLWFNLIAFNGECWQSFGPIIPFSGMIPDDIFFFATELHPLAEIENEKDIYRLIDKNPVPFQLLIAFGNKPRIYSKDDQVIHNQSWEENFSLNTKEIREDYIMEYNEGVYQCQLRNWEHPHFSIAYYDENEKLLTLSAMTDKGFDALVKNLHKHGFNVVNEPDIRVTPVMLLAAGALLKKRISISEYDNLFTKDIPAEEQEGLDNLNAFITSILPDINAGKELDMEKLAKQAGVDVDTAKDLVKLLRDKLK